MPRMSQGRWYPTNVIDRSDRMYAYSGKDGTGAVPATHEVYDPATRSWAPVADRTLPTYPSLHLLQDGRLAYTGAHSGGVHQDARPSVFDPAEQSQVLVRDPHAVIDVAHRNAAMSALVGSARRQLAWVAGGGFPAVRSTYFIDLSEPAPAATPGPRLRTAKAYVSVSHLPDMTALETGGGTSLDTPVFEASILDPNTRTLRPMAPPRVPRTYHSSSITLPGGRVATFGGDPSGDDRFELRIEVFSPPYLFKGTRPTITSAPTEVHYGASYALGAATAGGSSPASAVLMRPGSATHSLDANQRVLPLTMQPAAGRLTVTMPYNGNIAPRGWYLLFVNDSRGCPSVGRWVHLS